MAAFLFVTFYAAMAVAALIVEFAFGAVGLVPAEHRARVAEASFSWNYTTFLNIAFLSLAAWLVVRFLRTGGPAMLRMMNAPSHGPGHEHLAASALPAHAGSKPGRGPASERR